MERQCHCPAAVLPNRLRKPFWRGRGDFIGSAQDLIELLNIGGARLGLAADEGRNVSASSEVRRGIGWNGRLKLKWVC